VLHRYIRVAIVALIPGACARTPAPKAREIASRLTRDRETGNTTRFDWRSFLQHALTAQTFNATSSRLVEIERDGARETINGFVLEDVFVPPGSGTPRTRRSFIAWPESNRYYVVSTAELHPSSIARLHSFDEQRSWYRPNAFAAVQDAQPAQSWLPREGTLDIADGMDAKPCPEEFIRIELPNAAQAHEPVTCQLAFYRVRLEGQFVTRGDDESQILEQWKKRHAMIVREQVVPGVRFTTSCKVDSPTRRNREPSTSTNWCLANHPAFWRGQSTFDKSVVDVTQMANDSAMFYPYRRIESGFGRPGQAWMYRWTFRAPDGRLVEQDSAYSTEDQEPPRISKRYHELADAGLLLQLGWGGHNQYLVSRNFVDPTASVFEPLVLDVQFGPRGGTTAMTTDRVRP